MTLQNVTDLFAFMFHTNPLYLVFLIPLFLVLAFFMSAFIIAFVNFYYMRVVRGHVKNLEHYPAFRKIFEYFKDDRGIADYWKIDNFISDFFRNPSSVDFKKYEQAQQAIETDELDYKKTLQAGSCELIR